MASPVLSALLGRQETIAVELCLLRGQMTVSARRKRLLEGWAHSQVLQLPGSLEKAPAFFLIPVTFPEETGSTSGSDIMVIASVGGVTLGSLRAL